MLVKLLRRFAEQPRESLFEHAGAYREQRGNPFVYGAAEHRQQQINARHTQRGFEHAGSEETRHKEFFLQGGGPVRACDPASRLTAPNQARHFSQDQGVSACPATALHLQSDRCPWKSQGSEGPISR